MSGLVSVTVGATLVHVIGLPDALVTVQPITPNGAGDPVCPVTIAFSTALPPKIGELEALMLTDEVKLETPRVTEFEIADK